MPRFPLVFRASGTLPVSDTDLGLPDLDTIPTQPPPPIPVGEAEYPERRPRAPRVRAAGRPGRLLALILATQAALVSSAVLVAAGEPSVAVSAVAVVLTDVFMVAVFAIMLGMAGRGR